LLKDIPLCLCLELHGREATVLSHYASFTDGPPSSTRLALSAGLAEGLGEESRLLEGQACAEAGLAPSILPPFAAQAALLVPFRARAIPKGLLLLADDRGAARLEPNVAFLRRLCEALVARLDNVALLGELRELAAELNRKVQERTRDLAERNLALIREREALRRSEERFRALIEKSTDMILVFDADKHIRFWSPSAVEALGWTADEVLGHRLWDLDLIHPDDVMVVMEATRAAAEREGEVVRITARHRHKDGSWRRVEGTGRNLLGDPAVGGIVVNARDVTAERLLEEQFRQAQKLESVGRLAGGVAHDFNNILTVILSCAEELARDLAVRASAGAPPAGAEDIEQIRAAAERARDLTRQLLAFARKQVVAPVPLDLGRVVRDAEKLLRRLLSEDVELVVDAQPGLWPILCDPGQIEQVLANLAVNARDAMPHGGTLTIGVVNASADDAEVARNPDHRRGDWVHLRVSDSGSGMSPEIKAHLFEPFFTTKEVGKGTGLGLATVHGIVAQNGGHIHVESEPGRGTTFELCFPRSRAVPGASVAAAAAAAAVAARGDETVLLVEDDPPVRSVMVRSLQGAGYRVLGARDGDEALAVARRHEGRLDLVVADVVMPGRSSRGVVEELRRERPGLRVLFVSGYPDEAIAQRGVLDQGIVFLAKPFTPALLLARIRALLDAR
jgi:PAS domain S-box-containing protein